MSAAISQRAITTEFGANAIPAGIPWGVNDNSVGYKGTIAVLDLSTGYMKMGVTGTGLVTLGRIDGDWDNTGTGHAAGAISVPVRQGVFPYYMGTSADAITNRNAGSLCYVIDNQTVGLTDGGGTRSIAGIIAFLDVTPTDTTYQQVFVQMGEYIGVLGSGSAVAGALLVSGNQSNTGVKTFSDSTLLQNNSAGTFATTLHSAATANRSFTFPDIASATGVTLEGAQTWVGVKTFATTSDPVFAKEGNHTLAVVDTTTAATAGGNLIIQGAKSGTSGTGGAVSAIAGAGDTTGTGGAAALTGGAGGSSSGIGGASAVTGGAGTAGNAAGGVASITGGAGQGSAAGGVGKVVGGVAGATGAGGAAQVTGGIGGASSGLGGAATIAGGAGTAGNSAGGVASLTGGAGQGSAAGGAATHVGGVGGATGAGGASSVTGGAGGATSGTGGAIAIAGGAGTNGGASGGAVTIDGGAKNGGGADGVIQIGTSAGAITLGKSATIATFQSKQAAGAATNLIAAATGTAIPVTANGSLAITQNGAETNTLADPTFLGQMISLFVDTDTSGARVVTAASRINQAANTIMTLSDVGDFIKLEAITIAGALKWQVIANDGVALT